MFKVVGCRNNDARRFAWVRKHYYNRRYSEKTTLVLVRDRLIFNQNDCLISGLGGSKLFPYGSAPVQESLFLCQLSITLYSHAVGRAMHGVGSGVQEVSF